jgi:hypothetical protein
MSTVVVPERPRTVPPWVALAAGVLPLAGFVLFLLVPYSVNDLHRLPLAEVASGLHDPKGLWPRRRPRSASASRRSAGLGTRGGSTDPRPLP